jgi:uncharacterized protein (DUF305 family)
MRARRPLALAAAGLALVLAVSACGSGHSGDHGGSGDASASVATGRAADIAFAQLMIPHHEQAVEMADMALARVTSPEVRELAVQIKAAQDPEIAQMRSWLSEWGAPAQMPGMEHGSDDHSGHDMGGMSMSGMMTAEDMAALEAATGDVFDRMWLQMMIEHHEGAVAMADQVLAATDDARVEKLAQAVIAGQRAEIAEMKGLLAP